LGGYGLCGGVGAADAAHPTAHGATHCRNCVAPFARASRPVPRFTSLPEGCGLIFAKGAIGTEVATGIGIYPLIFFAVSTKTLDLVLRPKLAAAR
jgi:hypothetical protein